MSVLSATTPTGSGRTSEVLNAPHYSFGQWVGWSREESGVETRVTVNFEKRAPSIAQILTHLPQNPAWRVSTVALIQESHDTIVINSPDVRMFDLQTGQLVPLRDFVAVQRIDEPLPKRTTYKLAERGRVVSGTWDNDLGRKGVFSVANTTYDPPVAVDHTFTWQEFKNFVLKNYLDRGSVFFRGQPDNSYKLRTSFHRANRNDLLRYLNEDVRRLRHAVNGVSNFYYRDNDAEHLGALLSLAQHHGFPTPLLDWTSSPYIAAYFAFTEPVAKEKPPTAARIFIFDSAQWPNTPSSNLMQDPMPNITFLRFPAHNNPRSTPQQSMASFSNVDDIETHVRTVEQLAKRRHMVVIDIPLSERRPALSELRLMGITPGSLFPGLDGICRSLKEEYFNPD